MKLAASCFIRLLWNIWELKEEYVLNDKLQVDYKDDDNNNRFKIIRNNWERKKNIAGNTKHVCKYYINWMIIKDEVTKIQNKYLIPYQ